MIRCELNLTNNFQDKVTEVKACLSVISFFKGDTVHPFFSFKPSPKSFCDSLGSFDEGDRDVGAKRDRSLSKLQHIHTE